MLLLVTVASCQCKPHPNPPQPTASFLPLPSRLAAGNAPPEAVCHTSASFLHLLVGLVMPTLLSAWCWVPPAEDQGGGAGGDRQGAQPHDAHVSPTSSLQLLCQRTCKAVAVCDRWLHWLSGATADHPGVRPVVAWFVLACAWTLCRAAAGL